MTTANTGLLTEAKTYESAMPSVSSMPRTEAAPATQVGVNVTAPESRSYTGFSENKSYDDRASDFKVSDDSLVENRVTGLLGSNSDYMKRAQGKAATTANRRGLLNSSVAAGAGAAAAIDAALPIAQQDANTFAQSDLSKQSYYNQTGLAEKAASDSSKLSAQDATQQSGAMQQQTENTAALNSQQGQINENLGTAADNRQIGLQDNQGAITQQLQKDSADQKSSLQAQAADEASSAAEQAFMQSLGLANQQFDFQKILSDQSYRQQLGISEQDFNESKELADKEFEFQKVLQEMDQDSRANLLQMQNANAALLQQSQSAANRFQDLAQNIAAISTSPDMNETQKAAAINQLVELSNKSFATQSALLKAAGVDNIDLTSEGSGVTTPELPSSPTDEQIQFDPGKWDAGNLDALRSETERLSALANQLPADSPEGIAARISHKNAEIRDLEIQYYATSSKNAHRQISGQIDARKRELARFQEQSVAIGASIEPSTPTGTMETIPSQSELYAQDGKAFTDVSRRIIGRFGS